MIFMNESSTLCSSLQFMADFLPHFSKTIQFTSNPHLIQLLCYFMLHFEKRCDFILSDGSHGKLSEHVEYR